MRIYPNHRFNEVHIFEPYNLEVYLFGVWDAGKKVVLSEWFATRTSNFLTIFSGISYLLWVPGPMVYALYLMKNHKLKMIDYTYAFLFTNFIGFIIYYAYPAAPPWYYINFGDATDFSIPGNPGLLAEFDKLVGAEIFGSMYNKNANVFAAIPSLHAAYPLIALFYALKHKMKRFAWFFVILTIGIWLAAVYSQHHYVIDLVLGMFCAIGAYYLMNWFDKKSFYQRFRQKLFDELSA